jgi:hypothetical protein
MFKSIRLKNFKAYKDSGVAEEPHFISVKAFLKKHEGLYIHDSSSACSLIGV